MKEELELGLMFTTYISDELGQRKITDDIPASYTQKFRFRDDNNRSKWYGYMKPTEGAMAQAKKMLKSMSVCSQMQIKDSRGKWVNA